MTANMSGAARGVLAKVRAGISCASCLTLFAPA